jgi:hypothetical protein
LRSFWDRVTLPDAAVLRSLIDRDLEQRLAAIIGLYRDAFAHGASARQRNSVLQHLDFMIAAATWRSATDGQPAWTALAAALQELRKALAG